MTDRTPGARPGPPRRGGRLGRLRRAVLPGLPAPGSAERPDGAQDAAEGPDGAGAQDAAPDPAPTPGRDPAGEGARGDARERAGEEAQGQSGTVAGDRAEGSAGEGAPGHAEERAEDGDARHGAGEDTQGRAGDGAARDPAEVAARDRAGGTAQNGARQGAGRPRAPYAPGTRAARAARRRRRAQPKVVALGGGMGLSASLAALRRITGDLTAVVTVADDGGSSGRLRDELGVLPPGDLRKALAALCGDDDWGQTWSRVIQHRFQSRGDLHDHAVGNLLIVALWEQLGDHVQALDLVGRLLGAHGRVLPMSAVPLELQARVRGHDQSRPGDVRIVRGQATVALTPGEVRSVHLDPPDPPAVPEAVAAVLDADWVVLGPGSWFSSVIPHLLVPELLTALEETRARRVLSLNLAPQPGETAGFSPQRHLEVLRRHAPKLAFDVVLADEAAVPDSDSLTEAARSFGAAVELAPVARPDGTPRHDPELLAAAYDRIFRMHGRIGPWR